MLHGTTFNKAIIAAFGPPLTTILTKLDGRFGWGMEAEFWTAVTTIVIAALAFIVPNAEKQ